MRLERNNTVHLLGDRDSNPELRLQRATCYQLHHPPIGQCILGYFRKEINFLLYYALIRANKGIVQIDHVVRLA